MPMSKKALCEAIKHNECVTKEDILKQLHKKIEKYAKLAKEDHLFPTSYYVLTGALLVMFSDRIKKAVLFEKLPELWDYYLEYQYDEFSLNIEHFADYRVDADGNFLTSKVDAVYKLVSLQPKAMSVDEYADFYDVEQGTVRQWIRRGKIRTAYKEGSEWKIPELSPPPSRGYEPAQYKWFDELENLPEEYDFLAYYVLASFYQDRKDKTKYHVLLVSKTTFQSNNPDGVDTSTNKELLLSAKEREKLELFMISHPQIKYCGLVI